MNHELTADETVPTTPRASTEWDSELQTLNDVIAVPRGALDFAAAMQVMQVVSAAMHLMQAVQSASGERALPDEPPIHFEYGFTSEEHAIGAEAKTDELSVTIAQGGHLPSDVLVDLLVIPQPVMPPV